MKPELANAKFISQDGYPLLSIRVNGATALIEPFRKPETYELGLVYVGQGIGLPDITITTSDGVRKVVRGFTDDKRLFQLVEKLSKDTSRGGKFKPGPVDIPDA